MKKKLLYPLALAVLLSAVAIAAAWPRAEMIPSTSPAAWAATPANIARGAYLANAGDCMACHTERGGAPYAGGRAMDTPFGRLYAPNITPDAETGLGAWSADDFWNALHNGVAREGRLLYPAFPYTNYTKITRDDADALYAYLRSLAPRRKENRPHELRFPYNLQPMLAAWRLLYFEPGVFEQDKSRDATWNRGAYLVEGLGHCSACHSARNVLGASQGGLTGGLIPTIGWYAPSLTSSAEAGLGDWEPGHIVQLLHTGVSPRGAVNGPMAEVVARSLQHLTAEDATAMAVYLKSLPATRTEPRVEKHVPQAGELVKLGRKLYAANCVDCHGEDGKGSAPAYPPLAGNRTVTMAEPANAIRMVLHGGFAPATAGNPRPYGMPPFGHAMNDHEVAAVVSYLRASWGHDAPAVTAAEVNKHRNVPLD